MNGTKLRHSFQSPWVLALFLLSIFLLTTGYKLGWDDQHLEIPLLKSLIDPNLYPGDYYVQSLKKNFSSYFYPVLARLIRTDQIPVVYFGLYVLSRYFLFYWVFKLWHCVTRDKFKAFICVLAFIVLVRVEEFTYRTFSHQELAMAVIFAGIYFFFKERFLLASMLLGLAANVHALYSLFPFVFMAVYLLGAIPKHGTKTLLKTIAAFVLTSLPFLIWMLKNRLGIDGGDSLLPDSNWLELYIQACPQNFIFPQFPQIPPAKLVSHIGLFYQAIQPYVFLISLFLFNVSFNAPFRKNGKAIAFCVTAFAFLVVCLIFTYFYPNKFVLDLNLIRNAQFLLFLLPGYTVLYFMDIIEKEGALLGFGLAILLTLLKFSGLPATAAIWILFAIALFKKSMTQTSRLARSLLTGISLILLILGLTAVLYAFQTTVYKYIVKVILACVFVCLAGHYFASGWFQKRHLERTHRRLYYLIPLAGFFIQFGFYHIEKIHAENHASGFWQLQRSWEDMQRYVQRATPVEAVLLVPYNMEMCGFRMFSERRIVVSYRDCGIVGFDYPAAREWQQRIRDVEPFKVNLTRSPHQAIKNAVFKYKADYIVFLRYASPAKDNPFFQRIYTNMDFALFKVMVRPEASESF